MVHTGKCYRALIDSGAAISLIRYSTYQIIDSSFKTPIQVTMTKLNTADGSHESIGNDGTSSYMTDYQTQKYYLALISRRNFPCHMPGIRKRTVTYRRTVDFSPAPETVNRRQLLGCSSQLSKYHPGTMVLFQSRSKDIQLKDI